MRPHEKARWLLPVGHDTVIEIPSSYKWGHDCGEPVPLTIDGIEVDAEALCHECAVELGLRW